MFNWGRAFYLALRAACIGATVAFLFALVATSSGGKGDIFIAFARGFLLFGAVRLGWEALTKKYPDA